ncbi:MAG: hypothetical protein M3096_02215 [Actinomycetia bacterium]|nr:hypothetical protein [Actinomycetes bacterium]
MNVPLIIIIMIVVIGGMIMISRSGSQRKKEAIADLQREKDSLHTPDIFELVDQEVRESGITDLPGAEGIDPVILLKAWKRDDGDCAQGEGSFVVVEGVEPSDATEADVTFDCPGQGSRSVDQ